MTMDTKDKGRVSGSGWTGRDMASALSQEACNPDAGRRLLRFASAVFGSMAACGIKQAALVVGCTLAVFAAAARCSGVELEFRMAPHDSPDSTVDLFDKQEPILQPVQTEHGVEMTKVGVAVVCWARNVELDGKSLFERYHEGRYVDRLPRARTEVAPGRHVIWPGNHAFTVHGDGSVSAESAGLAVADRVVTIKAYPVTVRAFLANPDESDLPPVMREAPLPDIAVRDADDVRAMEDAAQAGRAASPGQVRELLPVFERFAPLTIWLPAHTNGLGYELYPMGITFHLTEGGIRVGAGGGAPLMKGMTADRWSITVPLYGFPVVGDSNGSVVVAGVEKMNWSGRDAGVSKPTHWYPRRSNYEVRISQDGPTMTVSGDLSVFPFKTIRADIPDRASGVQRGLIVELPARHFKPGETVEAQIQGVDPGIPPDWRRPLTNGIPIGEITNRLAGAAPVAMLKAYGSEDWKTLAVSAGTGGLARIVLPAGAADGLYVLRIGLDPGETSGPPITADTWVTVAAPRDAAVGAFIPRGRDSFYCGEEITFGVAVIAVAKDVGAGASLKVSLADSGGKRFVLSEGRLGKAVPSGQRMTRVFKLSTDATLALAPGRYRIETALEGAEGRPCEFDMTDPEPLTHFGNIRIGKYSDYGARYAEILKTGIGAEEMASELTEQGFNGFMGMAYDMNRVARPGAVIESVVRERPELGPWEAYVQPSGRDRFLNACVRRNLRFWENLFTYNDTSLPRGDAILDACARYAALEVQSMRHSPAFQGVCLYDEIYFRSLIDPSPVVAAFEQAMELGFRARHPDLTSAKAMKAMDRFVGRPPGQRNVKDLETFRQYMAWEDECWKLWCSKLVDAVKLAMPSSRNFVLNRYWGGNGGNIGANGYEPHVYQGLEIAACVMYKDGGYGDRPVFAPMQADVMSGAGPKEIWTQLHNFNGPGIYGHHLLRQAFFGLSQSVSGFTYFCMDDDRDAIENIAGDLCTRYGDFFLALKPAYRQVAIYYSRQASYLGARKPNSLAHQVEGLWVACVRAGFPADILRDEDVAGGRAMEYAALFAPGFAYEEECPEPILAQLKRFAAAGKHLFVERSSKLPVEGAIRLKSELDEYDSGVGSFPKYVDFGTEEVFDQTQEMTALVRDVLSKRVQPAARHNLIVGPDWLGCGDAQYMFIPNFNPAVFKGLYKTLYQAPDRPRIEFPQRPPVCYDVLENERVATVTNDGWMAVDVDMTHYPGKILAFLPEPVRGVKAEASGSVSLGGNVSYRVSVIGESGNPMQAAFPVEIEIIDPVGKVAKRVYRAAAPEYVGVYTVPVNGKAGRWQVRVRELVAGSVSVCDVEVTQGPTKPPAAAEQDRVRLEDAGGLAAFLEAKSADLAIPLEPGQEWARPAAERIRSALSARGIRVSITDCQTVCRPPGDYSLERPVLDGTRLWRGDVVQPGFFVDRPVILLGRRGENRLIEAAIRRDLLAAPLTSHFPGPGGAVVTSIARAFDNHCDAVLVLAEDAAGLAAGVEAFLSVKPDRQSERAAPLLAGARPDVSGLATGQQAPRRAERFQDRIRGEDIVMCVDMDPRTGRVAAGTFGYGDNLFCLGADGRLLWKTYLPEHDVYCARWCDDGRRIVAATGRGWYVYLLNGDDGKVLKKVAATEWPDTHWSEGAVDTHVPIIVNPNLRQILVAGRTGVIAMDYEGRRMWVSDMTPAIVRTVSQSDMSGGAPAFPVAYVPGGMAVSPDGKQVLCGDYELVGTTVIMKRLTDVWAFRPRLLDASSGAVIAVNTNDPGNQTSPGGWSVRWPQWSLTPWIDSSGLTAPLQADGTLGKWTSRPDIVLGDGTGLEITESLTRRVMLASGRQLWSAPNPAGTVRGTECVSPDGSLLYRSTWDGDVACQSVSNGAVLWRTHVSCRGFVAPVERGVVAGTVDGVVARLGNDGKQVWSVCLRKMHEAPTGDYGAYVKVGLQRDPDCTAEFYPVEEDRPGEYEGTLRFGMEQLVNCGFEDEGGWKAGDSAPVLSDQARSGKRSLLLAPGTVVKQQLDRRIVPNATYLLEFFYRTSTTGCVLTAGAVLAGGEDDVYTLSNFAGRPGEWHFGRVALKSMAVTTNIAVGFEATGGEVLVDDVSLRPVRFPSANILAVPELHAIEPVCVKDPRIRFHSIPPDLKQKLMSQNRVAAFKQGGTDSAMIFREEEAYLHNGRLDDVGRCWFYQPDGIGFSAVLARPSWISHVVLYLNNATPDLVYQTIAILANNLEKKIPEVVSVVRNNKRRFIVVHFSDPVFTDCIQILPGRQIRAHSDTLTEVELYGPVGGPATSAGARKLRVDAAGWPMFMGDPSHVVSPPLPDLEGRYVELGRLNAPPPAFFCGPVASSNLLVLPTAEGRLVSCPLARPEGGRPNARWPEWGPSWAYGTVTPLTTPAWYAGRFIIGAADDRLHAVAENGAKLWSFRTGGRVYSDPAPVGDDVFFGSDDGNVYKVDTDAGILIWEFRTGGKVRGAAAVCEGRVYAASWDGFLYCIDAESGKEVWKAAIAPFTRSSPAVADGRVYIGDEAGRMRCFSVSDGAAVFEADLGARISRAPLVTESGVAFAADSGRVAMLSRSGERLWTVELGANVAGQPLPTRSQLLVPTEGGPFVLRQADGAPDDRVKLAAGRVRTIAMLPYGGRLAVVVAGASTSYGQGPVTYAGYYSEIRIFGQEKAE